MAQTSSAAALAAQAKLVVALQEGSRYPHPAGAVVHIETHISHVLLAGEYAYKIKKPVDLGFLDFTTLAARRFYCEEELRLNRRLAPKLYLEMVAIGGSCAAPVLGAAVGVIEYAVKMRRFPQEALFDRLAARSELECRHVDDLAGVIAAFHGAAARTAAADSYGSAAAVAQPMRQNFSQIKPLLANASERGMLAAIENWSLRRHADLVPMFEMRRAQGFVRECHGDLHLGNVAWVDDAALPFDCIEFNAELSWIDVMSEVAFLVMDLSMRGRDDLANRFLDGYLERSGDYAGLALLDDYLVYRAMVRAKIAAIRAAQPEAGEAGRRLAQTDCAAHLALALRFTEPRRQALVIMHGLSGSGKSWVSQRLVVESGMMRLRSDVERKRLQGLAAKAKSGSGVFAGLYREEATRATYAELARLARLVLAAGWPLVIDAAFLQRWQREIFRALAAELALPLLIVSCRADTALLRERVRQRGAIGRDASEADQTVLEQQMTSAEPLESEGQVLCLDTAEAACGDAPALVLAALQSERPTGTSFGA